MNGGKVRGASWTRKIVELVTLNLAPYDETRVIPGSGQVVRLEGEFDRGRVRDISNFVKNGKALVVLHDFKHVRGIASIYHRILCRLDGRQRLDRCLVLLRLFLLLGFFFHNIDTLIRTTTPDAITHANSPRRGVRAGSEARFEGLHFA